MQASMTGHLVLTTLHTNDAVSAVTRLVDMGVEPFLVASVALARGRPAPGAHALRRLRRASTPRRPTPSPCSASREADLDGATPAPRPGLRRVRRHRLPRPHGRLRGPAGHRRAAPGAAQHAHRGRDRHRGPRQRHADPARLRARRRAPRARRRTRRCCARPTSTPSPARLPDLRPRAGRRHGRLPLGRQPGRRATSAPAAPRRVDAEWTTCPWCRTAVGAAVPVEVGPRLVP